MSVILNSKTIQILSSQCAKFDLDLFSEIENAEALTEKGASSYSIGDHDPRVVLFTKSVRGIDLRDPSKKEDTEKFLEFLLGECWKVSPLDTLRLIFHIRDCRGGKGEKLIFRSSCVWLLENHPEDLKENLKHVPFYGTWKDSLQTFGGTSMESYVISLHCKKLKEDLAKLGTDEENTIDTGAAKFAPSEGCSFDKKWNMVHKFSSVLKVKKSEYRKKYLRPLRSARVPIVEEAMCAREWDSIVFSNVPSIAGKRYKKSFEKHCAERYAEYLKNVSKGIEKINVSVLTPPEIISKYMKKMNGYYSVKIDRDNLIEAQWSQMVKNMKNKRTEIAEKAGTEPVNALCVVDVSGSMYSNFGNSIRPIDVSVSLGVLISSLNDEKSPFYKKWITFSENPKMETLQGTELYEMINNMDHKNWGMSTNFHKVFELILETAQAFSVPQEKMPKMLIVISDMQFDEASGIHRDVTNWDYLDKLYKEKGYERPTLVFWNVRSNTLDMPVPHSTVPNCALLGGYSINLIEPLIDGDVPSPMALLRKVIDSPRYERISLHEKKEEEE